MYETLSEQRKGFEFQLNARLFRLVLNFNWMQDYLDFQIHLVLLMRIHLVRNSTSARFEKNP